MFNNSDFALSTTSLRLRLQVETSTATKRSALEEDNVAVMCWAFGRASYQLVFAAGAF
jgi:hypothetical protein